MPFNAIEAGRAFLKVFVDDKDVAPAFDRLKSKGDAFVTSFSRIAGPAAAVGTALAAASAVAIKYASDAQETMSKFDVVFGHMSKSMKTFGDNMAQQMGRSKYAVAGSLASFQDLLVPMGMAPQAAAEMSKTLSALAIDLGSFNNMADADVIRDLQAALTGSGEVMKKYGVIVSEAAVKQEVLNMGLNPKIVTEAQKAQARLNIIMRGTTAAQGDAVRTADGFANQLKRLNDNAHDAAVELGNILLPAATELAKEASEVAKRIGEWVETLPESLTLLDDVAVSATGAVGAFFSLAEAIDRLNASLGTTASLFTAISPFLDTLLKAGGMAGGGKVGKSFASPRFVNSNPSAPFVNTPTNDGQAMPAALSAPFANTPSLDPMQAVNARLGINGYTPGGKGGKKFRRRLSGWAGTVAGAASDVGGFFNPLGGLGLDDAAGKVARFGKRAISGELDAGEMGKELGKNAAKALGGIGRFLDGKVGSVSSLGTFNAGAVAGLQTNNLDQQMLNVLTKSLGIQERMERKGDGWGAS